MLRKDLVMILISLLAISLIGSTVYAKGGKGEYLGVVVPGPKGPDLSTPPIENTIPRTVTTMSPEPPGDVSAMSFVHEYEWLGKSPLPDEWRYSKTVAAVYCDRSMTSTCVATYSDSSTTSGSYTTNITFDSEIIKVQTGFNIGISTTKTNTWSAYADPGFTAYIDEYDVYYRVNWWGRHDRYWAECKDLYCYLIHIDTETGGGIAYGSNYLAGHVYQVYGRPF